MIISLAIVACIFLTAFLVALLKGVGWAFVAVYLPSLILLNQIPQIEIPHAPVLPYFAPLYAILLAMPFRTESLRLKWCSIDTLMVLLLISATITAWSTEVFETGINTFRTDFLTLIFPYFLARAVFSDWHLRRAALNVMIGLLAVISVAALIEFRIKPYFFLHLLQDVGINNKVQAMAYERYGFYRVAGPVEHPIYFGNMCVVMLGLVAVLARTSGLSLKSPLVATALFAAFGCVITSISFTPYVGTIAGTCALLTLVFVPFSRKLVLPMTMLVIVAVFAFTYTVATSKMGEKPEGDLPGSLWTRKLIIHESWQLAAKAGPFGLGIRPDFDSQNLEEDFDLKSVDNSYMQFTLTHGYVYTILWTSIGVFFAYRMSKAFAAVTHPSQVFPLAASTATVLGLMVSMFTVWAGALYTVVWIVMLGLSNTLIDAVLKSRDDQIFAVADARRGFPVMLNPPRFPGRGVPNFARKSGLQIAEGR